jgi:hypothetical protein
MSLPPLQMNCDTDNCTNTFPDPPVEWMTYDTDIFMHLARRAGWTAFSDKPKQYCPKHTA